MFQPLSRFLVAALLTVSAAGLSVVSFDADAARAGSGKSVGSQSSNVTSKAPASAAAPSTMQKTAAAPAAGAAAGAAAKTGASKWLGPLAGIAAGLGIAALLSHFGLGGAMGDFLMVALLAGVVIFAVMFVVRMLRRGSDQPAMQGAGAGAAAGAASATGSAQQPSPAMMRETAAPASTQGNGALSAAGFGSDAAQPEQNWFIPADFDSQRFLHEAKQQFISIQKVWDSGDVSQLRNFLTDDLMKELQIQLSGRTGTNVTEVVLLNAEMLGIEQVTDGHLASVRFSGMLREQAGAEAFRFEEVWNLFKPEQGGWLLAGIQQIPVDQAG